MTTATTLNLPDAGADRPPCARRRCAGNPSPTVRALLEALDLVSVENPMLRAELAVFRMLEEGGPQA
jgi:hypothetical protein